MVYTFRKTEEHENAFREVAFWRHYCQQLEKQKNMKTLSLKLDDAIFEETEKVVSQLNMPRNRYINEALNLYNQFHKRKALQKKLTQESGLVAQSSAEVLAEFEKLTDEV